MKTKAVNKKQFTPSKEAPQPQMQQQMKPLKEILYELNQQFDNIKALYNNLILQQEHKISELTKGGKNE